MPNLVRSRVIPEARWRAASVVPSTFRCGSRTSEGLEPGSRAPLLESDCVQTAYECRSARLRQKRQRRPDPHLPQSADHQGLVTPVLPITSEISHQLQQELCRAPVGPRLDGGWDQVAEQVPIPHRSPGQRAGEQALALHTVRHVGVRGYPIFLGVRLNTWPPPRKPAHARTSSGSCTAPPMCNA